MQRRWPFWRTLIIALHCSGTEVERWIFCDALDSLPWEWLRPSKNGWKKRIELTSGWGQYRALDSAHKWGILRRLEPVRFGVQNKRKEVCQCRWRSRPWLSSRWAVEQVWWWSQEPYLTKPYQAISYHTIPYQAIPYHTISYYTIPYRTIPYRTIQWSKSDDGHRSLASPISLWASAEQASPRTVKDLSSALSTHSSRRWIKSAAIKVVWRPDVQWWIDNNNCQQ